MRRRIAAIMLAVCGGLGMLCGGACAQADQPAADCSKGKVEERLDCLNRAIDRQQIEILLLKWELWEMKTPKISPLVRKYRVMHSLGPGRLADRF